MTDSRTTPHICSICGQEYYGFGNNAHPINDGRCCDICDNAVVTPRRIADVYRARKATTGVDTPQYSVCQFFKNGEHEYVRRGVTGQEAARAFTHYISSVGAQLGMVTRVILTDGGDCVAREWQHGKGVVFPEQGDEQRP